MKPSSLIGHVIELLDLVVRRQEPADRIAAEFFRKRHYLGAKDRRFISDALFDLLRHYRKVRFVAEQAAQQVGLASLPPIALYIAFAIRVRSIPPEEVLSAAEAHWKFTFPKTDCAAFLRAVEDVPSAADVFKDPVRRLSLEFSFPEFIIDEWVRRFGEEETQALCTALNAQAPTVIRVNTLKATRDQCAARLAQEGVETQPTRSSPFGLVLHKRVGVTSLASFREGWFEMQDEGSQLLSLLLEAEPGQIVVDACAGGGGKSLHLASLMRNEGVIHAFDVDQARLGNMRPRLVRSGATIVHLHPLERDSDPVTVPPGSADAVLVDAPCSGVGTFRRNPDAKLRVSEAYVLQMRTTQRAVLDRFAGLVRRGGRLVYTTCTLLHKENEETVEEFLSRHPEFDLLSAAEVLSRQGIALADADPFLLLLPHRTGTDGFFGAVMQRRA